MNPYFLLYRSERVVKEFAERALHWLRPSARPYTSAQLHYLESLVQRFCARTPISRGRCLKSAGTMADPRSVGFQADWTAQDPMAAATYPLVVEHGDGPRVWDVDGNTYVDFVLGWGLHLFGHSQAFLVEALRDSAGGVIGGLSHLAQEVGQRVVAMTGVDRVGICNTGTEAVMYALRLARAATGRKKIVVFRDSYHGSCAEATYANRWPRGAPPGIERDLLVMEYNSPTSLTWIERFGKDLAGVLLEPVRSRYPGEDTAPFLQELRRLTASQGAALIFDEVVLGFRLAPGGAQEWFGVQADLVTYGKTLGGGLPIGAVGGTARFMAPLDSGRFDGVMFAGTFNRNPHTMATTLAVLRHLEEQGPTLQNSLNELTASLVARLQAQFVADGVNLRVSSIGSLFRFEHSLDSRILQVHFLERGFLASVSGGFYLSTAHGERELEEFFQATVAIAREMQSVGLA